MADGTGKADDKSATFNDVPVGEPADDAFGIASFAKAIADSIRGIAQPIGTTLGLNGPWGAGKTSAVNLVRYYLADDEKTEALKIVEFKCWWFKGDEALTLAFLQELKSALETTLGDRAKKVFGKLGRKLLQAGPIVGPAVGFLTGGLSSPFTDGAGKMAKEFFDDQDTLDRVMDDLTQALAQQKKRFLVIIDDIDRLTPDEALQVFRLIKSVGRLPNVIYLTVFDRLIVERAAKRRYPSEGPHFLEKIIQASFDLPLPEKNDLYNSFLRKVAAICGEPAEDEAQRFWNVFYDGIAPMLALPRDVVRLTNSISVTWPSVAGEVDLADYLALETLRLNEPSLHSAIRQGQDLLCGTSEYGDDRAQTNKATLEALEAKTSQDRRSAIGDALMRLFPRLEGVGYVGDFEAVWDSQRRVCSKRHFDKYFRFSIGDDVLSAGAVAELVEHASDEPYLRRALIEATNATRRNGQSRVPVLLDELRVHAKSVAPGDIQPLVATLFSMADAIDLERDDDGSVGFGISSDLRLRWLIRSLLKGRPLAERSAICVSAAQGAPVGWLADFFSLCHRQYHPRKNELPAHEDDCFVLESELEALRNLFVAKVTAAARGGSLRGHRHLGYILFRWKDYGGDDGAAVKQWLREELVNDAGVAALCRTFTSASYSQGLGMFGLGDRVAKKTTRASVDALDTILDLSAFRERVEGLREHAARLSKEEHEVISNFLDAWKRQERNDDDD